MRNAYAAYICPACGELHQFAGFCAICRTAPRLELVRMIPVPVIESTAQEIMAKSAPVPTLLIEQFVESLLRSSSP